MSIKDPPHNCAQPRHIIPADPNFEKKRSSSTLFALANLYLARNRMKSGLTSSNDFTCEEERISKKKAVELFENGLLDTLPAGKFSTLQAIHRYLFEDIYDFAGNLRTVNLAKANFRFAPLMYLEAALTNIDKMPQSTFDEIIEKYVEMNIAHPFREGNGRSTRIWLDHFLKTEIGKVDKEAMERSPIKDVKIRMRVTLARFCPY